MITLSQAILTVHGVMVVPLAYQSNNTFMTVEYFCVPLPNASLNFLTVGLLINLICHTYAKLLFQELLTNSISQSEKGLPMQSLWPPSLKPICYHFRTLCLMFSKQFLFRVERCIKNAIASL
ncbi:uncharacterized protein LOC127749038 [Frankliniella occidentalis]|uniref:Uncharacterized protein LOC127749038 n=1 Tax=Frankliniella occidentalis TaxID=133901 RepID=A0A9C6U0K8_FRAOC|nr:uncharacterized protein LOC127749038 [Frankliniella occidentalis]